MSGQPAGGMDSVVALAPAKSERRSSKDGAFSYIERQFFTWVHGILETAVMFIELSAGA